MNDRFKFRAWNKKFNQMLNVPDILAMFEQCLHETDHWYDGDDQLSYEKDLILMQCTGLKDKNGKLIYEGDILKVFAYDDKEYFSGYCVDETSVFYYNQVIFDNLSAGFKVLGIAHNCKDKIINHTYSMTHYFTYAGLLNAAQVIGNIYEHKGLLK